MSSVIVNIFDFLSNEMRITEKKFDDKKHAQSLFLLHFCSAAKGSEKHVSFLISDQIFIQKCTNSGPSENIALLK